MVSPICQCVLRRHGGSIQGRIARPRAFESALDRRLGFHPHRVLPTDFGLATWPAGAQEKMRDSRGPVTGKADIVGLDDADVLRRGTWAAVLGPADLPKGNAFALTPARGYRGGSLARD